MKATLPIHPIQIENLFQQNQHGARLYVYVFNNVFIFLTIGERKKTQNRLYHIFWLPSTLPHRPLRPSSRRLSPEPSLPMSALTAQSVAFCTWRLRRWFRPRPVQGCSSHSVRCGVRWLHFSWTPATRLVFCSRFSLGWATSVAAG